MGDIQTDACEVLVVGDLNAKSPLWGSNNTDERGDYVSEWMSSLNLEAMNDGMRPTFVRGASSSFIDVTLATPGLAGKVVGWEVSDEESLSLHRYITFGVDVIIDKKCKNELCSMELNKEIFRHALMLMTHDRVINHNNIADIITSAQDLASTRPGGESGARQPYWWNEELEDLRRRCNICRRRLTRARSRHIDHNVIGDLEAQYKRTRGAYTKCIRKSKKQKWRTLVDDLENDIWGQGYQLVMRYVKSAHSPYNVSSEEKFKIVKQLFPSKTDRWNRGDLSEGVELFTMEEILEVGCRLKSGRAPGPDKVTSEAVKEAVRVIPEVMLNIMNTLIEAQSFPNIWKRAKVVLIPKGPTGNGETLAYRPICLLDTIGKLYEHLLKKRLESELEDKGGLANLQFGFRKGKSTVDAVKWVTECANDRSTKWGVVIMIDVKNAFNTATWSKIIYRLREMEISRYLVNTIESYLSARELRVGKNKLFMTQGVPQGSVLGPFLWNVLYDSVLSLQLPMGCFVAAYADDLALIVKAENKDDLSEKANASLVLIERWMEENELKLAPAKTEAVIIRGPRIRDNISFEIGGNLVVPKKHGKYLGIWLDDRLSFSEHIRQTVRKAERLVTALGKLMPNIRGVNSHKRAIMNGVMQSTITYGAPVWHSVMSVKRYRTMVTGVQRRMLLRVASAYRTTSAEALYVITGVIPIDLLIEERARAYSNRGDEQASLAAEREITMNKWQARWNDNTSVAQWTKKLIPQISPWVKCKFRNVDYFLTQFLTGHGSFRTYTRRIGKTADDNCVYCGAVDTAEHTINFCDRWHRERNQLESDLGLTIATDSMVEYMLQNANNWGKIHGYIRSVMRRKEEEERRLQGLQ